MKELKVGRMVHYVQGDGSRSAAVITQVHGSNGVVDLDITNDEGTGTYSRKTVVHSEEPKPYTWHFIAGEQGLAEQETLLGE